MKKAIKVQDIRNITKIFNLNEDEKWELENIAEDINAEKGWLCKWVQSDLYYGTKIEERRTAINAMLLYFGKKIQERIGWKLEETSRELGSLLKLGEYQIQRRWFGIKLNLRFKDHLEVSDTFGLNYLEIV